MATDDRLTQAWGSWTPQGLRTTARSWFWFILAGTIIGLIIAFGLSVVSPPGYTARVTMLITPTPRATGITTSDLAVVQALTPTFAELATTRPVLDRVIASTKVNTDPETLAPLVATRVPVGTSLLTISVSNKDAADAAALANAIASQLSTYASLGGSGPTAGLQVDLTVVDPATPPTIRDGPGIAVRIALGGAIGLFLTISLAFLGENIWPQRREFIRRPA